jgi:diguanylate cyclase (GGDEF)-like protein
MAPQEKFSILLIDDDAMVVRILGRILSDFTPVRFATSGRAALKLARESIPDLVLLDVDMPEMSGFDICRAFKTEPSLANVPIIFITGHESAQLEAKGLELGAADFLRKPPHAPLVLARVRSCQRLKALSDSLSDTLRDAVTMDFLTGALNRRQLEKVLRQELLRSQRTAGPLALLIIDVENFKRFNGSHGESQGDECLKSVAEVLRMVANRSTDILGRYAGGRFALLLPETNGLGARTVAQRAIHAVDALQLPGQSVAHQISICVGVGVLEPSRPGNADMRETAKLAVAGERVFADLVAAAEKALQMAAGAGGHALCVVESRDPMVCPVGVCPDGETR